LHMEAIFRGLQIHQYLFFWICGLLGLGFKLFFRNVLSWG